MKEQYQQELGSEVVARLDGRKEYKLGMAAALFSAVFWGFMPIYWQALRPIDSGVIIFYRILLVGVVCFLGALKFYGWEKIKAPLRNKSVLLRFFLAGLLITINWSIFIWAVNANQVIQTCIGYYIEPLMVCVFGMLFFKETIRAHKLAALLLALVGVVILLAHFKEPPVIALSLAVTFATYAAIKKSYKLEAMLSLLYETMFLAPVALVVIVYMEITGKGALVVGEPYQLGLLLFCGFFTAIPLGLFTVAANKIPLVSLGITEYISPSISLIIGIFLLKEDFDSVQFLSFVVIWVGLAIFTAGEAREGKRMRLAESQLATRGEEG